MKMLPEYAQCAAELGCTRATAIVAPAGDERPYHENFEFHRRRFQELCEVLNASGIRLAVGFLAAECHRRDKAFQFIHDIEALVMLINMVGASNLGLLLDIWEVVASGGSMENVAKLSADQIVAVQVADMPADVALGDMDEKCRLLPGGENGRIDVAQFLASLKELGYKGPVTVTPSRTAFQTRRRELVVKQAAESLKTVWPTTGQPSVARAALA
jgi:sugar phosphate isomerase/epimerase